MLFQEDNDESANHRRIIFSASAEQSLPLFVESIGINFDQEPITRPDGYPLYHWLQTEEGEGALTVGGTTWLLSQNSGLLLPPGMSHHYEAVSPQWRTMYLTFDGAAVFSLLASLGMNEASYLRWEKDSPCDSLLLQMLERLESVEDMFGLEASVDAYRFLGTLSKFGRFTRTFPSRAILIKFSRLCGGWKSIITIRILGLMIWPTCWAFPAAI